MIKQMKIVPTAMHCMSCRSFIVTEAEKEWRSQSVCISAHFYPLISLHIGGKLAAIDDVVRKCMVQVYALTEKQGQKHPCRLGHRQHVSILRCVFTNPVDGDLAFKMT